MYSGRLQSLTITTVDSPFETQSRKLRARLLHAHYSARPL